MARLGVGDIGLEALLKNRHLLPKIKGLPCRAYVQLGDVPLVPHGTDDHIGEMREGTGRNVTLFGELCKVARRLPPTLEVFVKGQRVEVPAYLGIDRLRAVQAPCHTHDTTGTVWLEGSGSRDVTLGQLFDVWGVRLTATCLGATCGTVVVTVDGVAAPTPRDVRLRSATAIRVDAQPV